MRDATEQLVSHARVNTVDPIAHEAGQDAFGSLALPLRHRRRVDDEASHRLPGVLAHPAQLVRVKLEAFVGDERPDGAWDGGRFVVEGEDEIVGIASVCSEEAIGEAAQAQ